MGFPTSVADEVLVRCGRHCCICEEFVGSKIELHHIVQVADGIQISCNKKSRICFEIKDENLNLSMSHAQERRKACVGACSQEHALRLDCIRRRRT